METQRLEARGRGMFRLHNPTWMRLSPSASTWLAYATRHVSVSWIAQRVIAGPAEQYPKMWISLYPILAVQEHYADLA